MALETITHGGLALLVDAPAAWTVTVVGVIGGWVLVVKLGDSDRILVSQRGKPRKFRRFEPLVGYLRAFRIVEFSVNCTNFDPSSLPSIKGQEAATRLRAVHKAAASKRVRE